LLGSFLYAQEVNTKQGQPEKKSYDSNVKGTAKSISLDGRSFKVTFTERQAEVKPPAQTGAVGTTDAKTIEKPVSDYSVFDANSKVMLTFSDGKILSPILADGGCPYRINTSGNQMIAFSTYCHLNTGNKKTEEATAHDTKMEVDAANAKQQVSSTGSPDLMTPPATVPPDETKQHLPPGVARTDNADLNTPPGGQPSPVMQSEDIQRQTESPVRPDHGAMAVISGVVNGNAIQGTLTWSEADGRKMSYAFSGSTATKKDMNDSHIMGMK